jgi:hypothetical protein
VIAHKLLQTLYLTLVCADFLGKLYRVALLAEVVTLALAVTLDSDNVLAHMLSFKINARRVWLAACLPLIVSDCAEAVRAINQP